MRSNSLLGKRLLFVLLGVSLLGVVRPARAAWEAPPDPSHHEGELQLFEGFDYDSGWVPADRAIQVRFGAFLGGGFSFELDGESRLSWPPALTLEFDTTPESGVFRMNIGFQFTAQLRFSLDVPGYGLAEWEGNIPGIGDIDFRFFDEVVFEPYLLSGAIPWAVEVRDRIRRIRLFKIDLTDFIFSIPGIGGGIELYVAGEMFATLAGDQLLVDGSRAIARQGASVRVPTPDDGPYVGTSRWEGIITGGGTLLFYPAVYIEIATWHGSLDPFEIPLDVPDIDRRWVSTDDPHEFGLPRLRVSPTPFYFPLTRPGVTDERMVSIANDGELLLDVTLSVDGGPFGVRPDRIVVEPGASIGAFVQFTPTGPGPVTGTLRLTSNDPRRPVVLVPLGGTGEGVVPVDAGPVDPKDAFSPRDTWEAPDTPAPPDTPPPHVPGRPDGPPPPDQAAKPEAVAGADFGSAVGTDGIAATDLGPALADGGSVTGGGSSGGCAAGGGPSGPSGPSGPLVPCAWPLFVMLGVWLGLRGRAVRRPRRAR